MVVIINGNRAWGDVHVGQEQVGMLGSRPQTRSVHPFQGAVSLL